MSFTTTLPATFTPTERHIIIGRGKVVKQHSANVKFDERVQQVAQAYESASGKADKGRILSSLLNQIQGEDEAVFVRKDPITSEWTVAEEAIARQTVAQALRNALSHSYRSSKQFKSKRRLLKMQNMQQQQQQQWNPTTVAGTLAGSDLIALAPLPPRCVSPSDSSICSQEASFFTSKCDANTFSILLAAFGNTQDENPFEPSPLPLLKLEPLPL